MPAGKKHGSHHSGVCNGRYRHKFSNSNSPKSCCQPMSYEESDALPNIPLPGHYSIKDLSSLLLRFQTFGNKGQIALRKFFSLLPSTVKSMKTGGHRGNIMEDLVLQCFPMIDDMLFFGLLQRSRINVRFIDNIDEINSLGYQCQCKNTAKGFRQIIHLYRFKDVPSFHDHYFYSYLSTLVHEMIHAFFALYQCRASRKCIEANAIQEGEFGDSPGHGPAFQRVEEWFGHVSYFNLDGIDLGIGYHIDPQAMCDKEADSSDDCDCCDECERKWSKNNVQPEGDDNYDLKWENWQEKINEQEEKHGPIPTYPEGLSEGLSYEYIPGEGYVLSPPAASRITRSENRNNLILELSPKQWSKFKDRTKKMRRDGKDARHEKEKTFEGLRKPRVAETSKLMDEMYGLHDY